MQKDVSQSAIQGRVEESLGFDPLKVSDKLLVRIFRSAWFERQSYVRLGLHTGPEVRQRFNRFENIKTLVNARGLDPIEALQHRTNEDFTS